MNNINRKNLKNLKDFNSHRNISCIKITYYVIRMDEQFKAFTFFTFEKRAVLIDGKWDARFIFSTYIVIYFFSAIRICNQKHIKTVQVIQHHLV